MYFQSNNVTITNNYKLKYEYHKTDIIRTKLTRSVSGNDIMATCLFLPVAGTLGNAKTTWCALEGPQGSGGGVRREGGGGGGGLPVKEKLSFSFIFFPS